MKEREFKKLVFENFVQAKKELIREGYIKRSDNLNFEDVFSETKKRVLEERVKSLMRENQMLKKQLSKRKGLDEEATTSWGKMMRGVNNGETGPWSIIVTDYNKVIDQHINIKIKDSLPAHYEEMKRRYPNKIIYIEDSTGRVVWSNKK
jgi:predicted nuclease with TOPRIM domain